MEPLSHHCYQRNWERRSYRFTLPVDVTVNHVREHPEMWRVLQNTSMFNTAVVRGMLPLDAVWLEQADGEVFECTIVGISPEGDVFLGSIRHHGRLSKPYRESEAEARRGVIRKVVG